MTYRSILVLILFPFATLIVVPWLLVYGLLFGVTYVMRYPLLALAKDGGGFDRIKAWVKHDQA